MKCASFRWVDLEWDIRTLNVLEKLMEMKGKAEEEARSWKEACTTAKEEANVKAVELQTITRYYGEVTHNLSEMRKKMRNDALLSPTEKGEANRLFMDKRGIPLRSASVRTPHLFHHRIPKVLVNPRRKGITSVRSTFTL
jgi:hypothetical protein